jgi:hypothetical protein
VDEEGVRARDTANLRWAEDRDRLLPGERPNTLYSEDAEHWVHVYTDLLNFNLEMMDVLERRLAALPATQDGPERSDRNLLQAHVRRLRWRLNFWERRRAQLTPMPLVADGQPPVTAAIP